MLNKGLAGSSLLILLTSCATGSGSVATSPAPEIRAQLFEGMGGYDRTFTTSSAEAAEYLNQGFFWTQAFNYDEAVRSFLRAAQLDPQCAMAWWGVAYAEGPSYNHPAMTARRKESAYDAIAKAQALSGNASPLEQELIHALSQRFADPDSDQKPLDEAYVEAMGQVYRRHPDDPDVGMLYAEAMMVLKPWQLYVDREPTEGVDKIESVLERVIELDPDLPGACHLYIHAVEQSKTPGRALAAADTLSTVQSVSGHLFHMPSHIYIRVNQWDRSVEQNGLAERADDRYRKLSPEQFTQHMYMVHNSHIRAYSAMMTGREKEALVSSRKMWTDIPEDLLEGVGPLVDRWMCSLYDTQKRFGRWDDLLAEPAPPAHLPITSAMWRAHRAVAHAAKKDFEAARREHAAFREIWANLDPARMTPGKTVDAVHQRLAAIDEFVPAEIALQQGDLDLAIEHLLKSVEAEDKLGFSGEPPDYLQPIRHTLGAVYLKAGRPADAEKTFREDLEEYPGNGWSLFGLGRALREQGKDHEAEDVEAAFRESWKYADEPLSTSCKCIPEV